MEYIFYILILVLAVVIISILNENKQKKLLKEQLKNEWGKHPEVDYSSEKMESIMFYYLNQIDNYSDVDDITWNDLDMNEIYFRMNNTQSALGEEYLYSLLRKPCFSKEELEERNRLIEFFQSHEKERSQTQMNLNNVGRLRRISAFEFINRLSEQNPGSNIPHYLMILGLIISIVFLFINPALGMGLTLISMVFNIITYYKFKANIENYITIIAFQLRLLDNIGDLVKNSIPQLDKYNKLLATDLKIFKRYKRGSFILVARNVSASIFEAAMDYYRMITHHDIIKYNSMLGYFKNNKEVMNRIFETVGFIDSMIAIASYRDSLDYYCLPQLTKANKPILSIKEVYHPLINNPIPNSITEYRSTLLTGSNASGKSTFIKSLAVNAILSQTIYTSLSREYSASYFVIYSSMALKDNILSNESYFIVEIKSLKRIIDNAKGEYPMLCFVDEVLRGTNTLERIAASSRILASLAMKNTLSFAATHDTELTYILEKYYSNYHFRERIDNNNVLFDYKLYKGRAMTKNAIKLLNLLGYSKDIIRDAEKAVDQYIKNGEWSTI